jgi:hypothetical protein
LGRAEAIEEELVDLQGVQVAEVMESLEDGDVSMGE